MKQCYDGGGRLCTSEELLDGCTKSTGCDFNDKDIWTGDSQPVKTYTNANIMDFARVFTGFNRLGKRLKNVEIDTSGNCIDQMSLSGDRHDKYPKTNLHGGYLGDRYPLCTDLTAQSFLSKGARYEFIGYSYDGPHEPKSSSKDGELYK